MNLPDNPPPDYPCMTFCKGRYYLCMFYIDFPKAMTAECAPHGGNITGQIWRFENEPMNWHMTYRFRYYADDSGDPNHPEDQRSWYYANVPNQSEAEALQGIDRFCKTVSSLDSARYDILEIRGTVDRCFEIMQGELPEWLHMTKVMQE